MILFKKKKTFPCLINLQDLKLYLLTRKKNIFFATVCINIASEFINSSRSASQI